MEVCYTIGPKDCGWVDGRHRDGYSFEAKVYKAGSELGIKRGRVSKLFIEADTGELVVSYDRGWQVRPAPEVKQVYKDILKFLETYTG